MANEFNMSLPAGRTCGECAKFKKYCEYYFGFEPSSTVCDFYPIQFTLSLELYQEKLDEIASLQAQLADLKDQVGIEDIKTIAQNLNTMRLTLDNKDLRDRIEKMRLIPVTERLPEKNYKDIGDEVIVRLDYPYERMAAMKFEDGDFYTGGWGKPSTIWTSHVTHWCSLPEWVEE